MIVTWLIERHVLPGGNILDAGCGTGRYAIELARRGYVVDGIDQSPELIHQAEKAANDRPTTISFSIGDIRTLPPTRYDGILCRGVLNDLLDDDSRQAVIAAFAHALRPGGVLVLDVREWDATAERKIREPVFRKRISTDRGTLTFSSVTELDRQRRRLVVTERHTLVHDHVERSSDYVFVMRCWTRHELDLTLRRCGFDTLTMFGAYDPGVQAGSTDRLVVVSQKTERDSLQPVM